MEENVREKPRDKVRMSDDANRIADDDPWAPPRTESYRPAGAKFVRYTMFALIVLGVVGAFAYARYSAPAAAPHNQVASSETTPLPQTSPFIATAPESPPQEAVPPMHTAPIGVAKPSSAPVPAPLADPAAAPEQSMDVDPETAQTPTPIPEKVAP